jgi:DNA invertase Pin-like site-specific DNA recombinase
MSRNPNRTDRHIVAARLTRAELEAVIAAAAGEGVSVSNFIRRCINGALLESGDDQVLLRDVEWGRPAVKFTDAHRRQARALRASGLPAQSVARMIGCSRSLVYLWLEETEDRLV